MVAKLRHLTDTSTILPSLSQHRNESSPWTLSLGLGFAERMTRSKPSPNQRVLCYTVPTVDILPRAISQVGHRLPVAYPPGPTPTVRAAVAKP